MPGGMAVSWTAWAGRTARDRLCWHSQHGRLASSWIRYLRIGCVGPSRALSRSRRCKRSTCLLACTAVYVCACSHCIWAHSGACVCTCMLLRPAYQVLLSWPQPLARQLLGHRKGAPWAQTGDRCLQENGQIYEALKTIAACYLRADTAAICDCLSAFGLNDLLFDLSRHDLSRQAASLSRALPSVLSTAALPQLCGR